MRDARCSDVDAHVGSREPRISGADALVEMARRELAGGADRTSAGDRYTVVVQVDAKVLAGGDGVCQLDSGPALAAATAERMICDGAIVPIVIDEAGETLNVGRKTRRIPSSIKRALVHRDDCCRFPGCFKKAYVDGHHIVPWGKGGETTLSNLVLLCGFHHRFVHEGGVRVSVEEDGRFTFTRANGWVVETAALSVEPGGVEGENASLGLQIDDTTIVPRWWNDPCDYSAAIDGLIRKNEALGAENGSAEPPEGSIPIELDVLCRSS